MRNIKRMLALILAFVCAVSFVACSGEDAEEESTQTPTSGTTEETESESPSFEYAVDGETCEIIGVNDKTKASYVIPDFVTGIGAAAFEGCTALTSITIPENVTSIGIEAFKGCSALTSVTFENTVGWAAGDVLVSEKDLSDKGKAAKLLKDTYCDRAWTRETEWSPWF